jgi:heme exporter protein D
MQLLEQCAVGLSVAVLLVVCVTTAMQRRTKFSRIAQVTL